VGVAPRAVAGGAEGGDAGRVGGALSINAVEGASFNGTVATFTDPAAPEPNASDPSGTISTHYSASINWGDGSAATAGTITISGSTFTVSGSHTYGEEGSYTLTVTIAHESAPATTITGGTATVSDPSVVGAPVNFNFVPGTALTNQAVASFTDPAGAEPNSSDPSGTI